MKDNSWQVVNLELSKKLKKMGIPQESLWWWHIYKTPEFCIKQNNLQLGKPIHSGLANDYSAFTVAELGKIIMHIPYWTKLWKEYIEKFVCKRPMNVLHYLFQPNSLAKFYLYLEKEKPRRNNNENSKRKTNK